MFSNLYTYTLGGDLPESAGLEEAMHASAFLPCGRTQPQSVGFVPPRGEDHGALLEVVGGHWVGMLMIETRILPSPVIKRRVTAKAKEIEKQTGRAPKGRMLKELKEEVVQELLPKAFTKQVKVPFWIDPGRKRVVVDAGSAGRADLVILALIACGPKMNLHVLRTKISASTAMTLWLSQGEAPADFSLDREVELRGTEEHPPVVKISERDVDADDVRDLISQGMVAHTLAMTFKSRVSFTLLANGTLRGVKVLDVVTITAEREEDADGFDADIAILTGELGPLLDAVVHELGGEVVLPIEAAASDDAADDATTYHGDAATDPLYEQAVAVVKAEGKASISMVQRHLRIGYNRAARLLERMETEGLVTAMNGQGARDLVEGVAA